MPGPLAGLSVIDTTEGAQGPWAAALLSDLGADVLKIEKPEGEMMRAIGPFKNGEALANLGVNHGKRNIVLDLKDPEERDILLSLVRDADVFMENWRPGVADRLGVGYEVLTAINPRLIYASASGFGQEGRYARKASVDNISQAMGGYGSLTGTEGGAGERPRFIVVDFTSPLTFGQGILLALLARDKHDQGQWVQCSQLSTLVAIGSVRAAEYFMSGEMPRPWGSGVPYCVPSQAFTTADSYVLVDCPTEAHWVHLCAALGLGELATDPRFATNADRVANRKELIPILQNAFLAYRTPRWIERLREARVPCGEVAWDIEDIYEDPQVVTNSLLVDRYHPAAGRVRTNAVPWLLARTPAEYGPLASTANADRQTVLEALRAAEASPA